MVDDSRGMALMAWTEGLRSESVRPPPGPAVLPWWISAFATGLVLAMMALGGVVIDDARRDAWSDAERASDTLLRSLDDDIARDIATLDSSLAGVVQALAAPALAGADPTVRHMALFGGAASAQDLGAILLVDAAGEVVEDSTSLVPRRLSIADRDDVVVQREHDGMGLYVSRPFPSRSAPGEVEVSLSRRRPPREGAFTGIVAAQLRSDLFRRLFQTHASGTGREITLQRADGVLLARYPARDAGGEGGAALVTPSELPAGAVTGRVVRTSVADDRQHLVTFRRIGDLPLLLTLDVAAEEILAGWWRKAVLLGGAILSLCAAVLALLALFGREMRRRAAAEAALAAAAAELQHLAGTDALTALPNRRTFDAELVREWRRAIRCGDAISLLMLDADRFKTFNDHHGHQRGDEVLRTIAACLVQSARRPGDLPARYGGEEFAMILPGTDAAGAMVIADMVRVAIERLDIRHGDNPSGRVTVSIGAATLRPLVGADVAVLLRMADAALYEAKRQGRNRVAGGEDWATSAGHSEAGSPVAA